MSFTSSIKQILCSELLTWFRAAEVLTTNLILVCFMFRDEKLLESVKLETFQLFR